MLEVRRHPTRGSVATAAILGCRNMLRTLAVGDVAIVTAAAGSDHVGVLYLNRRNPIGSAVTILAAIVGRHMRGTLAILFYPVMATDTVSRHFGVVISCGRPTRGGMAVGTDIVAGDMIRTLAVRHGPVMATRTGTENLRMIDPDHRRPFAIAMTTPTGVGGSHMGVILAGDRSTIVATCTVRCHCGMFEVRRRPSVCGMTLYTVIAADDMILRLTAGDASVVTANASPYDVAVRNGGGFPGTHGVAAFADVAGRNMLGIFAGYLNSVMTAHTVAGHSVMIVFSRPPGAGVMAVIAGPAVDGDMAGGHTCRDGAVVTAGAGTEDGAMVHPGNTAPTECGVAEFTAVGGGDMPGVLTHGGATVMTVGTAPRDIAVVETRLTPVGDGVAVITLIVALNMVGRFAIDSEIVVAAPASRGGTGKQSVYMASVAGHVPVTAGKRKTGGEMVVVAGGGVQVWGLQPQDNQHQAQQQCDQADVSVL